MVNLMFIDNYLIIFILFHNSIIGVETILYNTNTNEHSKATSAIDSTIAESSDPIETTTKGNRFKKFVYPHLKGLSMFGSIMIL